ncbi:MAG: hypothetical protein CM15mV101_120 [uncultured marine virus]|nr:MAG: hypothetical protein CM15mV101_120 [uncultured marine virus]
MESKQVDLSSYYKQYVDKERYIKIKFTKILEPWVANKFMQKTKCNKSLMKPPNYIYQERIRQATLKRVILEKELRILQGR